MQLTPTSGRSLREIGDLLLFVVELGVESLCKIDSGSLIGK